MVFWVIATLLLLAGIFIVLRPLRSIRPVHLESNRERNIAIAKERRNEINSAFETGDLTLGEKELAMQDLETALADELSTSTALSDKPRKAPKIATPFILASIPIIAIGIYLQTGTVNYPALTQQSRQQQAPNIPSLDELVAGLEIKARKDPTNEQGLFLLAQTYNRIGRHQQAVATYQILLDLVGPNADLLAAQAEATMMQNQQVFSAQSLRLLSKALDIDPHHIKARWLSGLGTLEFGNPAAALENWLWIASDLQTDPAAHAQLKALISDVEQTLGSQAAAARKAALQSIQAHNESAKHQQLISGAQTQTTQLNDTSTASIQLKVDVGLAPSLAEQAAANAIVLIIAKARNGPKAPLAVVTKTVADLPFSVTLDDSNAMLQTLRLSQFDDVIITARISKSGQAVAQTGDLQSTPYPTKNTHSETISLTIDKVLK